MTPQAADNAIVSVRDLQVQFQTSDPNAPLAVSARAGEPPVFALGDETFALPS